MGQCRLPLSPRLSPTPRDKAQLAVTCRCTVQATARKQLVEKAGTGCDRRCELSIQRSRVQIPSSPPLNQYVKRGREPAAPSNLPRSSNAAGGSCEQPRGLPLKPRHARTLSAGFCIARARRAAATENFSGRPQGRRRRVSGRPPFVGDQNVVRVSPRQIPEETFGQDLSIELISVWILAGRGLKILVSAVQSRPCPP